MAWEQRGAKGYYYRSVRRGRRVTNTYIASGPLAEAWRQNAMLRHAPSVRRKPRPGCKPARRWRPSMPRLQPGGTQAVPSLLPHSRPRATTDTTGDPGGASARGAAQLRALLDQANSGSRKALEALCARLPTDAAHWAHLGDLTEHAREALIILASGEKALFQQELCRKQCQAMTRELAGADPTPLETLLVDRIVVCWLHLHYAETIYAQNLPVLPAIQAAFYQHRITAAHNRYLSAIRTLAQVRRLQVPNVQINVAREQLNVAAITAAPPRQHQAER